MNIEELLADTFAEHEYLAPDEASVRAEIDARTRRGRLAYVRPLAIAASVIVVAGAAVGAALLSSSVGSTHQPSPGHHGTCSASAPPTRATAIKPVTMPFDLGYLPKGSIEWTTRDVTASKGAHPRYLGQYEASVGSSDHGYFVDVTQLARSLSSVAHDPGVHPVRIDGRKGYEATSGRGSQAMYELTFDDSAGGTMSVTVSPNSSSHGERARLVATGRRIASAITFPGIATVQPPFGLGYLPAGMKILAFVFQGGHAACVSAPSTQARGTAGYGLGRSVHQAPVVSIGTNFDVPKGAVQHRTVQGHPTRYGVHDGYRTVQVQGAVYEHTVSIMSKVESKATLYRIADHLQLPKG